MCRCCAISWSRARNSQEHQLCLSLQVWAPEVPPTPLVINETQPVYFAPQYKTRYPFYRWVGWWAGVLLMFFFVVFLPPALGFEPVSSSVFWVINPRQPPGHPHTHTHTHTHTSCSIKHIIQTNAERQSRL